MNFSKPQQIKLTEFELCTGSLVLTVVGASNRGPPSMAWTSLLWQHFYKYIFAHKIWVM